MEPRSFASLLYGDPALEGLYGWLSAWARFQRAGTAAGLADEYRGLLQARAQALAEASGQGPGQAPAAAPDRALVRPPQFALSDRQGVPLHRILLVYAPASSGKTSTVHYAAQSLDFSPCLVHAASCGRAELEEEVGNYLQKAETPGILSVLARRPKPRRELLIVDDVDCCPDSESLGFLLNLASTVYYKQSLRPFTLKRPALGEGEPQEPRQRLAPPPRRRPAAQGNEGNPTKPSKPPKGQPKPIPLVFVATDPFAPGLKPLREKALLLNLRFPDQQKVFTRVSSLYPRLSGAEITSSLNRAVEIANGNVRFLVSSLDTLQAMLDSGEAAALPGMQQGRAGPAGVVPQQRGLTVRAVEAVMLTRSAGGFVGLARAVLLRSLVFALLDETTEFSALPARNSSALVAQVKACGVAVPYLASLYSLPTLAQILLAKNCDLETLQNALRRIEETADQTLLRYKFASDRDVPSNEAVAQFYEGMSFLHSSWSGSGGSGATGGAGAGGAPGPSYTSALSCLLGLYAALADSPFHNRAHEGVYRALVYPGASPFLSLRTLNATYAAFYENMDVVSFDPGSGGAGAGPEEDAAQDSAHPVPQPDTPSLYSLLGARRNVYLTEYLPYAVLCTTAPIPDTGNFSLLGPDARAALVGAAAAECHAGFFEAVEKASAAQEKEVERRERLRLASLASDPAFAVRNPRLTPAPSCVAEALKDVMAYSEGQQGFCSSYSLAFQGGFFGDPSWARQKVWGFALRRLTRNSVVLFLSIGRSLRALQAAVRGGKALADVDGTDDFVAPGRSEGGETGENGVSPNVYVNLSSIHAEHYQKALEHEVLRQLSQTAEKAALGVSAGGGEVEGVVYEFHEGTTQAVRRKMRGRDLWA